MRRKELLSETTKDIRALYYCGMTYTQIAVELSLNRETVASYLRRTKGAGIIVNRPAETDRYNWTPAEFAVSMVAMREQEYGGQPVPPGVVAEQMKHMSEYLTRKYSASMLLKAYRDAGIEIDPYTLQQIEKAELYADTIERAIDHIRTHANEFSPSDLADIIGKFRILLNDVADVLGSSEWRDINERMDRDMKELEQAERLAAEREASKKNKRGTARR